MLVQPMLKERRDCPGQTQQHVAGKLRSRFAARFNDLRDPQEVPRDTDYASVFESDVPIVVQHTRLDSRQAENALMTTVAYAE